jgi:hypothetical protein
MGASIARALHATLSDLVTQQLQRRKQHIYVIIPAAAKVIQHKESYGHIFALSYLAIIRALWNTGTVKRRKAIQFL